MIELCKVFLSVSISGGILTAVLLLLKKCYNGKISKKLQYYIWLAVVLRFLIPLSFEYSLVNQLIPHEQIGGISTNIITHEYSAAQESSDEKGDASTVLLPDETINEASIPQISSLGGGWENGVFITWFLVSAILILWKVSNYFLYIYGLKHRREKVTDIELLNLLSDVQEELKIKKRIELIYDETVASPVLIGFFHPIIVLSDKMLSQEDTKGIFHHELTHQRRSDLLYKWLVQITLCLHWFNPLVYAMAKEVNKNCELSCDESLMKKMSEEERHAYGEMLLRCVGNKGVHNTATMLALSENGKQLKERLFSIKYHEDKSYSKYFSGMFILLVMGLAVGMGTYVYAGEKIQKDGMGSYTFHNYMMSTFYEDGYLFQLGATATEEDLKQYCDVVKDITLEDGSVVKLYFFEESKEYAKDETMESLFSKAILKFSKDWEISEKERYYSIHSVEGPYKGSPEKLAKKFYKEEQLTGFAGVFDQLKDSKKKSYADKFYKDSNIAFFSVAVEDLNHEMVLEFANRAYEDVNYSIFSMSVPYLEKEEIEQFIEESYKKEEIPFFAILVEQLDGERKQEWINRARKDGKMEYNNIVTESYSL